MAAVSGFAVQVLRGLYLGLLAGVVPVLVAFGFGFAFRYVTGITVPAFGVVVLAVAIAGINGGLLAFNDPTIAQSANGTTILTALVVILMMSFYAHAQGDRLGARLPKHLSLRSLRERRFSREVVDLVGSRGQVTVDVVGDVADMEGYPPLPDALRAELRDVEWAFPADLPVGEIESRFENRLRGEFDLAAVDATLDERARATVVAAPPMSGVSKRVPPGKRAVSVDALVPTGVARGDEVTVVTPDGAVTGTVVSAKSGSERPADRPPEPSADEASQDIPPPSPSPAASKPAGGTTTGGEGRVTLAVDRTDAESLVAAETGWLIVLSRGTRREFELVSVLRRAGQRLRRFTVGAEGDLAGRTLGETDLRHAHGVAVVAVRHDDEWTMAPRGSTRLEAGDEFFAAGPRDALDRFAEVAS